MSSTLPFLDQFNAPSTKGGKRISIYTPKHTHVGDSALLTLLLSDPTDVFNKLKTHNPEATNATDRAALEVYLSARHEYDKAVKAADEAIDHHKRLLRQQDNRVLTELIRLDNLKVAHRLQPLLPCSIRAQHNKFIPRAIPNAYLPLPAPLPTSAFRRPPIPSPFLQATPRSTTILADWQPNPGWTLKGSCRRCGSSRHWGIINEAKERKERERKTKAVPIPPPRSANPEPPASPVAGPSRPHPDTPVVFRKVDPDWTPDTTQWTWDSSWPCQKHLSGEEWKNLGRNMRNKWFDEEEDDGVDWELYGDGEHRWNPKFDLVIHSSLCSSSLGVVVILDFLARSSGQRTVHKPSLVVYESGITIGAKQLIADQQAVSLQHLAELENHLEEEHSQAATFSFSPSHVECAGGGGHANILDSAVKHHSKDQGGVGKPKQVHASKAPTLKMPAKAALQSTTFKTAKKSRTTQADIDAHCKSLLNADLNDKPIVLVSGKCKSSKDSSVPKVVKKARAANPSGLLAGWTQHDSSVSSGSSRNTVQTPHTCVTTTPGHDGHGCMRLWWGVVAIKQEDPAIMIKTELTTSHPSITGEAGSGANGGFVKVDLPAGAKPCWSKEYIPMVLDYIGTLPNPWDIAAINLIKVFQQIWDLVFSDILYLVNDKGAVYTLAQQKIYDWRSGFAKSAADHVARFFQLDIPEELKRRRLENTAEGHATYIAQQIAGNYLFLYGDVKVSWNKPFQSQLVLATLAYHMDATAGAILYIEATPRGALAMSTVAVERAIGMYTTGAYITPREKFVEQIWSCVLNLYKISIETLMPGTWDVIVDSANGLTALDRNLPNLNEAAGPVDGPLASEARSMVQLCCTPSKAIISQATHFDADWPTRSSQTAECCSTNLNHHAA
ncbi:predicted protein [Postia placenta Mad-698-R]|nr:predicted protein [Postia placenta Mad-698-R]